MPTREQEAWPPEVWLNRFTDLPLEWWGNPSTVGSPEPIAGGSVEAQRYLPAQSIGLLVEALEEIAGEIYLWQIGDGPHLEATDLIADCHKLALRALSDFKDHTHT